MRRKQLLERGRQECGALLDQYPSAPALLSVMRQIEYLIALDAGTVTDRSRLKDITIGLITAREIEPLDDAAAEILHEVAGEARRMSMERGATEPIAISEARTGEILLLINALVSGADQSIEAANRLELLLDDAFPDDDYLQETVEMLACYRPEGGREVLGIESIRERLNGVSTYLSGHR